MLQDDAGKALDQSSVVTVDEKSVSKDVATELITVHQMPSDTATRLPPSPVSRISISSRASGTRKKSNITVTQDAARLQLGSPPEAAMATHQHHH